MANANGTAQRGADRRGAEIRALRRALGLSQQQVAERAACSVASVRLLESGYMPRSGESDVQERIALVVAGVSKNENGRDRKSRPSSEVVVQATRNES
jgi:transcriptional regulator with XRE-family HTH domain